MVTGQPVIPEVDEKNKEEKSVELKCNPTFSPINGVSTDFTMEWYKDGVKLENEPNGRGVLGTTNYTIRKVGKFILI